ncbi:MAG: hypothetical protein OHK0018_16620 [Erythrobacter tepidarius]
MCLLEDQRTRETRRKRLQVLKAPCASDDAKQIKMADKIANLRDLKTPPVGWDAKRVGAYIQFAEMVAGGCVGANPTLDHMFEDARASLS